MERRREGGGNRKELKGGGGGERKPERNGRPLLPHSDPKGRGERSEAKTLIGRVLSEFRSLRIRSRSASFPPIPRRSFISVAVLPPRRWRALSRRLRPAVLGLVGFTVPRTGGSRSSCSRSSCSSKKSRRGR